MMGCHNIHRVVILADVASGKLITAVMGQGGIIVHTPQQRSGRGKACNCHILHDIKNSLKYSCINELLTYSYACYVSTFAAEKAMTSAIGCIGMTLWSTPLREDKQLSTRGKAGPCHPTKGHKKSSLNHPWICHVPMVVILDNILQLKMPWQQ